LDLRNLPSDVARPVWPVATHTGQLTARRLVVTFVPTAFRALRAQLPAWGLHLFVGVLNHRVHRIRQVRLVIGPAFGDDLVSVVMR
jgi:hypothetical protein